MSSYWLMFPGVRSSLVFSGFGLKPPASGFQSYSYGSLKTSSYIQHQWENIYVNDEKFLHSEGHLERFTELNGEEKKEKGDAGDQEEKRGNQKGREQASQYSLPYVLSTVWIPQRCSRSYTERRGRKETEVARGIKGGIKRRETDLASTQLPKCSPQPGTHKEIHWVG